MDTTKTVTHVSLCAGYGGIDLGLKRAIPGLCTIAFSEIEAFACANLVAKMEAGLLDAAPIWTNLKTFPWSAFCGRVDILSGGYPCQPFSAAGKRLGADDPRHLWPFIADGIRLMRPRLCFFENVEGHISLGLRAVVEELAGIGYETTWGIFSASEVGAPHQRKRVFILAVASGERSAAGLPRSESWHEGHAGIAHNGSHQDCWPSRPGEPQHEWEPPRVVGDTPCRQDRGRERGGVGEAQCEGRCAYNAANHAGEGMGNAPQLFGNGGNDHAGSGQQRGPVSEPRDAGGQDAVGDTASIGSCGRQSHRHRQQPKMSWARPARDACIGQAEPTLGGNPDGPAGGVDYAKLCVASDNRTDELRLLGNGVVPAVAHKAFITLASELFSLDIPHTNNDNQIRQ